MTSQFSVSQIQSWCPNPVPSWDTQHDIQEDSVNSCRVAHLPALCKTFSGLFTSSSDSPVFQIYLVFICLALLLLKKEHIFLLSLSYTICHEAELFSPFFGRFRDLRFVRTAELLAGKLPLQPQEYQDVIRKHCMEARQVLLNKSVPGLSGAASQDPRQEPLCMKTRSQPGGCTVADISLSSSFQCPQPSCLLTPTVHQPHPVSLRFKLSHYRWCEGTPSSPSSETLRPRWSQDCT